jgi:hypothetical protein
MVKTVLKIYKVLGPWHSWGRQKVPRLTPKPDPLIYDHCQTSLLVPLLVSLLAKSQELPVSQLARHVNLLHLVITDNRRPETLSLPPWLGPSYKAHYPFQPSPCSLNPRETSQQSVISINLSFPHTVWSLFGSSLHKDLNII